MSDAPFQIEPRTIFLTLAGSQAHGTAREGSDVDLRGVCVAPLDVRLSLFHRFEQLEGPLPLGLEDAVLPRLRAHPTASRGLEIKVESVIFELAKFVGLCAVANPNALEILFADERDWVFETPTWRRLHAERHRFLTRKVQQTFLGYALMQLKKIRTHRAWLLTPPTAKPSRDPLAGAALGKDDQHRIEQSVAERLRGWSLDDLELPASARIALSERLEDFQREVLGAPEGELEDHRRAVATHALQLPADVVRSLNAEKRYRGALRQWEAYQAWKQQRNPARAALELKHGYDTKHAMHLVRLMRMGLEVLDTGALQVRRPDAGELSEIRDGALSYDALLETAESLQHAMQRAASTSRLPHDVDRDQLDALAFELLTSDLGSAMGATCDAPCETPIA